MIESTQHKLDRIRSPRVQITYDVEIGNASEEKELPFVVGILADLSGNPAEPLPRLKDRKFVEVDRSNFEHIMAAIHPRLTVRVKNQLEADAPDLSAELFFATMDDFGPLNVVKQVDALSKIYHSRCLMKDLMTKLDGNGPLDDLLSSVLNDANNLATLKGLLGADTPAPAS